MSDMIERLRNDLTSALATANNNHERFEREWYLRGDRIEKLEAALKDIANPNVYDTEDLRRVAEAALQEDRDE